MKLTEVTNVTHAIGLSPFPTQLTAPARRNAAEAEAGDPHAGLPEPD